MRPHLRHYVAWQTKTLDTPVVVEPHAHITNKRKGHATDNRTQSLYPNSNLENKIPYSHHTFLVFKWETSTSEFCPY